MRANASVLCLLLLVSSSFAEKGLDISNYNGVVPQSTYSNFMNQGYDFSIVQAWQENHPNTNFQQNYNNAIGAGMDHVDAYAFVCNTCHGGTTPSQVVSSLQSTLPSGYQGTVWLDVEQCSGCWTGSGTQNHQFVSSIASQLQSQGYNVGVYSNKNEWNEVMGSDAGNTALDNLPLWYAHYDSSPSFNDPGAYEFGGWSKPEFKQYEGSKNVDGQSVDLDYGSNVQSDIHAHSQESKPASEKSDASKADPSKAASKSDASKAASSKADSKSDASKAANSKENSADKSASKAANSKENSADKSASKTASKADSSKANSKENSADKSASKAANSKENSADKSASKSASKAASSKTASSKANSKENSADKSASKSNSAENFSKEASDTFTHKSTLSNEASDTFTHQNSNSKEDTASQSSWSQASSDDFSGESDGSDDIMFAYYLRQ